MSEAFSLNDDGDLNVSKNGVIRLLTSIDESTLQSAIILIASQKGTYPFAPSMGLDFNTIFEYQPEGMTSEEAISEICEYLMIQELSKDPNIGYVSNFTFAKLEDRKLKIEFDISLSQTVKRVDVTI